MTKIELLTILSSLSDDAKILICPLPDSADERGVFHNDLHSVLQAYIVEDDGPDAPAFAVIEANIQYED
jgi:hypothetical protein